MPDDRDRTLDAPFVSDDVYASSSTLEPLLCAPPVRLSICFSTSIEVDGLIFVMLDGIKLDGPALLLFIPPFLGTTLFPLTGISLNIKEEEEVDFSRLGILLFF